MKKQVLSIASMALVSTLALSGISSTYAQDTLDLDSLDGLITEDTATASGSDTGSATVTSIDNISVVHSRGNSVPAHETTTLLVSVTGNGEKLDDTQVSLSVNIDATGDSGSIGTITYNTDGGYFEVPYTAGADTGTVQFAIQAVALNDPSITFEQGESITVTEAAVTEDIEVIDTPVEDTTVETENTDVSAENEEVDIIETEEEEKNSADKKIEANIKSTKVIGENKLVIYFDRELFLPEEPLSLITITKVKDSSEVKVSNVALGEDKKSLVVLTTDKLGKEEYRLTINEVVDGKTKKRINVVNGTLTITGLTEIIVLILALMIFTGILFIRKRK